MPDAPHPATLPLPRRWTVRSSDLGALAAGIGTVIVLMWVRHGVPPCWVRRPAPCLGNGPIRAGGAGPAMVAALPDLGVLAIDHAGVAHWSARGAAHLD